MVQWTEKPPPRERAESHGEAVADSQYGTQKKPLRRKRTLTPLYVTMIVLIGAAIPAGYLLLSHMPSASDPAHPKQAARDLTTGRIIIASEADAASAASITIMASRLRRAPSYATPLHRNLKD